MSNERRPGDAYREQHFGGHAERFTTDSRIWREPEKAVFQYRVAPVFDPWNRRTSVTVFKPEARTRLRIAFGFRPLAAIGLDDIPNPIGSPGVTLRQALATMRLWLAECEDFGGGLRECGDLVGTQAVPVQFIADGNWGAIFEIDVDCKAVRAQVDSGLPQGEGALLVSAKWTGDGDMSDRDWQHAREKMQITVAPKFCLPFIGGG
jgi:hypothetical protein